MVRVGAMQRVVFQWLCSSVRRKTALGTNCFVAVVSDAGYTVVEEEGLLELST